MNDDSDNVTRGSVVWSDALAQSLADGRSATPPVYVQGAPPSPVSGSYEKLLDVVNRHAAEVQKRIIDLPPAVRDSQGIAGLRPELARLANAVAMLQPAFREQLDASISANARSARLYFLLGLACAVPVGLLGSFLAFLLGWS